MNAPHILDETDDYAVVIKPPRMHCAPHGRGEKETLLDWYAAFFPAMLKLRAKKEGEGGLLHRLDYETQGLVLFAKNQRSFDFFAKEQEAGLFVKEYHALCEKRVPGALAGFPPPPEHAPLSADTSHFLQPQNTPFMIESFFRPFGPGRKEVRPVAPEKKYAEIAKDRGETYKTHLLDFSQIEGNLFSFTLRITRGFRHQIRCHLSWLGFPILNDPIYGAAETQKQAPQAYLALRAQAVSFPDPRSGELRIYRIPQLEMSSLNPASDLQQKNAGTA
jgi:23S rRNA pseudouridine1911/1915/1917 synthase